MAIYYVSNTGSDLLSGLTPSLAWQTLAKVQATSLVGGDRVRLKRDGLWREQLIISNSGGVSNPIVFESYGIGATPTVTLSLLLSSGWSNAGSNRWTHAQTPVPVQVFFNGTRGTLEASQAAVNAPSEWFWAADVLTVYSTSDPATAFTNPGIEVDAGGLSGNTGAISSFGQSWLSFIDIHCTKSAYAFWTFGPGSFVTFTTCEASLYYYDGFGNGWTDCTAINCTAHDGRHTGLTTNAARTRVFGGSYYNNAPDEDLMYAGGGGVGFGAGAVDCLVQGVTSFNNIYGLKAFGDGCDRITFKGNRCFLNTAFGIDIDGGAEDCIVEDNLCYDNVTHQIAVELVDTKRTIVRRNRVYNAPTSAAGIEVLAAIDTQVIDNIVFDCYDGIALYSSPQRTLVAGNTIDGSTLADINCVSDNATINGVILKNNICSGSGIFVFHADTNTIANFTSDFNNWAGATRNTMRYNGVTMNLDRWRLLVGQDANSHAWGAGFTNAVIHDYSLAGNSPNWFAGANLGTAYALTLKPGSSWPDGVQTLSQNSTGLPWNIGAYGGGAGAPTVGGQPVTAAPAVDKEPSLAMLTRDYSEPLPPRSRARGLCPTCGEKMDRDEHGLFCWDCN